jgi:hypothetical protein
VCRRCRSILVDFDDHELRVVFLVLQEVKTINAGLHCRFVSILQRGLFEGLLHSRFGLDRDMNCIIERNVCENEPRVPSAVSIVHCTLQLLTGEILGRIRRHCSKLRRRKGSFSNRSRRRSQSYQHAVHTVLVHEFVIAVVRFASRVCLPTDCGWEKF